MLSVVQSNQNSIMRTVAKVIQKSHHLIGTLGSSELGPKWGQVFQRNAESPSTDAPSSRQRAQGDKELVIVCPLSLFSLVTGAKFIRH